ASIADRPWTGRVKGWLQGGCRRRREPYPWTGGPVDVFGAVERTQRGKGTHVASSTRRPSAGGDRVACSGRGGIRRPGRRRNARNQPVHDQEPEQPAGRYDNRERRQRLVRRPGD